MRIKTLVKFSGVPEGTTGTAKRDGKDWKERFNKDFDSILRLNYPD